MKTARRLITSALGLLSLSLVVITLVIPFVWLTGFTAPRAHLILSGADPIITAYLENALFTIPLLTASAGLFLMSAWRMFASGVGARNLVLTAEGAIVVSLGIANARGITTLHLSTVEWAVLIAAMAALAVTVTLVERGGTENRTP